MLLNYYPKIARFKHAFYFSLLTLLRMPVCLRDLFAPLPHSALSSGSLGDYEPFLLLCTILPFHQVVWAIMGLFCSFAHSPLLSGNGCLVMTLVHCPLWFFRCISCIRIGNIRLRLACLLTVWESESKNIYTENRSPVFSTKVKGDLFTELRGE